MKKDIKAMKSSSLKEAVKQMAQLNIDPGDDALKAIESAKLKVEIAKDASKLKKSDFAAKWGAKIKDVNSALKLGNMSVDDLYDESKSRFESGEWSDESQNAQIKKYQGALEKWNKDVSSGTQSVKDYLGNYSKLQEIKNKLKQQGYDPDTFKQVDPYQEYVRGITQEAEQRIKNKQDIPIYGAPKEKATCINGVCTLAANQGVDFSNLKGKASTVTDAQGRTIPIQNQSFFENINKTGYYEVPAEQRRPGDMAMYQGKQNQEHMELILNNLAPNQYRAFNNYSLTNYKNEPDAGISVRSIEKTPEGKMSSYYTEDPSEKWTNTRFYRIKPEAAEQAYYNLHPEYKKAIDIKKQFESSGDDFKKYQSYQKALSENNLSNILGKDQAVLSELQNMSKYKNADEFKKAILPKVTNKDLVTKIIDNLYTNETAESKK